MLVAALVIFGRAPDWELLPLIPVAMVVLLLVAAAIGVFLSAANVYLRDVQHLLELALVAWFWMSAIVYPFKTISDELAVVPSTRTTSGRSVATPSGVTSCFVTSPSALRSW